MKKFTFLAIVISIVGLSNVGAQSNKQQQPQQVTPNVAPAPAAPAPDTKENSQQATIVEPEWPDVAYLFVEGKLVPLEAVELRPEMKSKALSGETSFGYFVSGATSPIKVPSQSKFVVKLSRDGNPAKLVNVDRLTPDIKAGIRRVAVAKVTGGFSSKYIQANTSVELLFSRYGSSLWFSPASPLSPGEYLVTTVGGGAYCFKVE